MIPLDTVAYHFLFFVLYSFLGWVWESVFTSMWVNHHMINRGFLNGPYCPIYGCGALANILLFNSVEDVALLFLLSGFSCCLIEYITSWGMEKMFHARWWDYSGKLLNINGRVCLLGFVGFAAFSLILLKLLHPAVVSLINGIPKNTLHTVAAVSLLLVLFDYVITLTGLHGFNDRLRAMSAAMESTSMDWSERVHLASCLESMNDAYRELISRFTLQQRRIIRAFPQLRSLNYEHALNKVRSFLERKVRGDVL